MADEILELVYTPLEITIRLATGDGDKAVGTSYAKNGTGSSVFDILSADIERILGQVNERKYEQEVKAIADIAGVPVPQKVKRG